MYWINYVRVRQTGGFGSPVRKESYYWKMGCINPSQPRGELCISGLLTVIASPSPAVIPSTSSGQALSASEGSKELLGMTVFRVMQRSPLKAGFTPPPSQNRIIISYLQKNKDSFFLSA